VDHRFNLHLVDSDVRRRAAISHALAGTGIHVEPYENPGEMATRWPSSGVILVEDCDGNIACLIEQMTGGAAWLPIVALSAAPRTDRVVRAIMEGAIDYLEWPSSTESIARIVAQAEDNAQRIGSLRLREARARSRVRKLTRREREVLEGVADGLSNRMIGEKLAISPRTVEIHRANMLHKMGAQHTSEAIRIAIEAALVA